MHHLIVLLDLIKLSFALLGVCLEVTLGHEMSYAQVKDKQMVAVFSYFNWEFCDFKPNLFVKIFGSILEQETFVSSTYMIKHF